MNDLISRQAAIDEIRKCRFVVDAIEKIRALPSAQPEVLACGEGELSAQPEDICSECDAWNVYKNYAQPHRKKGKWLPLFNGKFKGGAYWFKCSECERIVPDVRNGGWNYCPNCGARMDEGE